MGQVQTYVHDLSNSQTFQWSGSFGFYDLEITQLRYYEKVQPSVATVVVQLSPVSHTLCSHHLPLCLYLPYHPLPQEAFCVCVFMWCVLLCIPQEPVLTLFKIGSCQLICQANGSTSLWGTFLSLLPLLFWKYWNQRCALLNLTLCGFCGFELRSLCLCSKGFTYRSISPAEPGFM